jgi:hypothetical protein
MDHRLDFRSIIPLQQVDLNVTDKSVVSLLVVRKEADNDEKLTGAG